MATTRNTLTTPFISINDRNPAYINVGDTYNDLGAMITGLAIRLKGTFPWTACYTLTCIGLI
jgi:hypothetical protein